MTTYTATSTTTREPSHSQLTGRTYRIESMDVLRGILMLLMAIDHVRDYFSNVTVEPLDLIHSWPALFITRWITHLCAPGFILLAGASVYLQRQRIDAGTITRTLILRGLWLILIDITVVTFGWLYGFGTPFLQVIWASGLCMIAVAGLQWLPVSANAVFGIILIFGHDLLDRVKAQSLGSWADAWRILHGHGAITYHGHRLAILVYPMIPWIGAMAVGYSFGAILVRTPASRQCISAVIGAASLVLFMLLRLFHGYGDPGAGFEHSGTFERTAMSFMSVQKYPPSLHFLLATLGIILLLFALFDKLMVTDQLKPLRNFLNVYGRVPFFFYIAHIYLAHALALTVTAAIHGDWRFWITPEIDFSSHLEGWGYSLPGVYLFWAVVVLALYPSCAWFSRLKDRRRSWWLSFL